MPRRIVSQDPTIVPSTTEKNLDSVVMTAFTSRTNIEGNTHVRAIFTSQDDTTKEFGRQTYNIDLRDFDQQVSQSPKLEDAWNTVNDIMGIAYDFYRLKEKIKEGQTKGEDVSALIVKRDDALTSLRAPL